MEESVFWHMCWHAAEPHDFVADRALATRIRQQLVTACDGPGRTLISYLVAPTEIHLLARLPSGEGPGTMARRFSTLVSRWLRQSDPAGRPVFAARVSAHCFTCDAELRRQVRMIAWRPVLDQHCHAPSHALHSSLRVALGIVAGEGYDARPLLRLYGDTVIASRAALRHALKRRPSCSEVDWWELVSRMTPLKSGPGEAATKVRGVVSDAAAQLVVAGGDGVPGALKVIERWVMRRLGLGEGSDECGRNGLASAHARALVACMAVQHGLCPASTVARHFGRSRATLCEQMLTAKRCAEDRQLILTPVQEIVGECVVRRLGPNAGQGLACDDLDLGRLWNPALVPANPREPRSLHP